MNDAKTERGTKSAGQRLSVRLKPGDHAKVAAAAAAQGFSISDWVRMTIERAIAPEKWRRKG